MTSSLLETQLDEDQHRQVRIVHSAGAQLRGVVDDLLSLAKAKEGGIELENIAFVPADVVDEAVCILAHTAEDKGVQLLWKQDLASPATYGDPLRLRQIVLNLLSNAIKFTESGTIAVVLSENPAGQECQPTLILEVTDTGIGIPDHALEKIFLPYQQAETDTARKFGGTGLGLPIVSHLIDLMDGSIEVTSELGIGSCFRVHLPLVHPEQAARALLPVEASAPIDSKQESLNVLLAEDHPTHQLLMSKLLENLGHTITIAGNGREALEHFARADFDLVLMDNHMPIMDGPEATRAIKRACRANSKQSYLVALTGSADDGTRNAFQAAGVDEILVKPIDMEDLKNVLERCQLAPKATHPHRQAG